MTQIRLLKLGYSNNKHKDTVYVLFTDRVMSVKEWFSKEFSEGYKTLILLKVYNFHWIPDGGSTERGRRGVQKNQILK